MINKLNTNSKMFLPVIHVENKEQATDQTKTALDYGADGVFLINHYINYSKLFKIYKEIRRLFNTWIGINCLDLEPIQTIKRMPNDVDGLWVDDTHIYEELGYDNQEYAKEVLDTIHDIGWKGLYFGGVAFKYQKKVKDLVKTTKIACKYIDIITTSGIGTGIPPKVKKIKVMSKIVHKNHKKIAIASGITPENIKRYKSADIFMVATGISYDFTHFNPQLIRELKFQIRNRSETWKQKYRDGYVNPLKRRSD